MNIDDWLAQSTWKSIYGDLGHDSFALCWEAAQKEAARRCAEICGSLQDFPTQQVKNAIEREFGLDTGAKE